MYKETLHGGQVLGLLEAEIEEHEGKSRAVSR